MKSVLIVLSLTLIAAGAATAAPITIDDFSTAQIIPAGLNGSVQNAGILGGERDVIANGSGTTFTATGGSAMMGTTGGPNFVLLDYDGVDGSTSSAYLLGDIDLTGGGINDSFQLNVASISGSVDWTVRVAESASSYNEGVVSISSPGIIQFSFASLSSQLGLGADFTGVERVTLRFNFDTNESITVENFSVGSAQTRPVPEPSSGALFGLGLCAVAALRRKRRLS